MVGGMNEVEVEASDEGPSTVGGATMRIELEAEKIGAYIERVVADGKIDIRGEAK